MGDILRKVSFSARAEHEQVVLQIGNADIKMTYVDALKLAQFLRMAGKQAKANAGDLSRHWSVAANLSPTEVLNGKAQSH